MQLAVIDDDLARDDRRRVAVGPLDEPARAGGEVVHLFWLAQTERVEVDHVHVRAPPGRERAAVVETVELCGVVREAAHDPLDREARAHASGRAPSA